MITFKSRKLVTSLIATLAISAASLSAADFGSVNGDKITNDDIAVILRNPNIDFNSLPKKSKNKILDQVIEKKLLAQNALTKGVESEAAYKTALEKLKKDLALEIWMQREFKKVSAKDSELKDFYNKNKAQFKVPATLEARHILSETEKQAKDIIKTLDKASNKKKKFIELAKTKSTGPSGPKGGYLGKFPETQMVPTFSKAAKALSKGKYSKTPVKTQFGYHVIYLEDKQPSTTMAFDKVKDRIKQVVLQEKFRNHVKKQVDALRNKAKIVIK